MKTILIVIALLAPACEEHQPVCVPKKTVDCFCVTGERGMQTCRDNGYAYGTCECMPDAGMASDAGADADADAGMASDAGTHAASTRSTFELVDDLVSRADSKRLASGRGPVAASGNRRTVPEARSRDVNANEPGATASGWGRTPRP